MSFLNPFRKNSRPEGVKLAGMTSDADPRAVAGTPGVSGERREPSLDGGLTAAPAFEGAGDAPSAPDAVPPAFAFKEPRVPSPEDAGAAPDDDRSAPAAPALKAEPTVAPWTPCGAHAEDAALQNPFTFLGAPAAPSSSRTATAPSAPEPARQSGMAAPQPAAAEPAARRREPEAVPPAATEPIAMEPLAQAPAGEELPPEPAAAPEPPPMPSIPIRLRTDGKTTSRPAASGKDEAEARVRTRHRYMGVAAILMAFVVAAPFVLDENEAVDGRPFSDERMTIPDESETSTTIDAAPVPRSSVSGDVDVSETTLGKSSSTARANLAREVDRPARPDEAGPAGTAGKPAAGGSGKTAPAEKPVRRAEPAPVQKPSAAKSVGLVPPTGSGWYVQVLATGSEQGAERVVRRLATLGLPAWRVQEGGSLWKVRVGLYRTKKEAEGAQASIILNGVAQKPYVRQQ